jgi:DNA-binding transcriptional LysR family regulator
MTLRQLEAFRWIARLGSFHAAARHLHVAQPSISARLAELERHLGVALFARSGRALRLTAKGRELLPFADRMLDLANEIGQRVGERDALRGRVRFGVTSVPAVTWMPKAMHRLAQAFPGITAEFVVDASENLRAQLLRGDLDLAFLAGPLVDPAIATRPVARAQMGWVASPELVLPGGALGPADIAEWPVITDSRGSFLHTLARDWFRAAGVEPRLHHGCTILQTRLQLARAGLGIAIAPLSLAAPELAAGALRLVDTAPPLPALDYFAAIAGGSASPPVQALLEIALAAIAGEPSLGLVFASTTDRESRPITNR